MPVALHQYWYVAANDAGDSVSAGADDHADADSRLCSVMVTGMRASMIFMIPDSTHQEYGWGRA